MQASFTYTIVELCTSGHARSRDFYSDLSPKEIMRVKELRGPCLECDAMTRIMVSERREPIHVVDATPITQKSGGALNHGTGVVNGLADADEPPEPMGAA